jgi:hypothetical protein
MHRHNSVHRFAIALCVMVSLLFSQMALASYVCPGMSAGADAMAQAMAEGEPCEGMDTVQPVLCHQHAADASQSFEKWQPGTPSFPAIVQVLVVPLMLLSDRMGLNLQSVPEPRPPPDPLFLSTHRLRV